VLPLSEIRAVHESVDDEWRSPVADAVAARWGIGPGVARYWRSSASHVFVVPPGADPRGVLYVRFVPAALRARAAVAVPAELLAALGPADGVVIPEPSLSGRLAETVHTPLGDVHAVVMPQAPGAELEVDELTTGQAAAWGAALARFHVASAPCAGIVAGGLSSSGGTGLGLGAEEDPFTTLADMAAHGPDRSDDALAAAASRLAASWRQAVVGLPRGVLHGDFELDNLRFVDLDVVAFDADETSVGPYALDIAAAVRDLVGDEGTFDAPRHPALLGAFLAGYGSTRALDDGEHAVLALGGAQVAARFLTQGRGVLDAGDGPDDPAWLTDLRARLVEHYDRARDVVLTAGART
jgi:Ser/Thr protein kinase RdoA (MazF antagonist)